MIQDIIIRVAADGAMVPIVLIGAYALVFKIPKGQRFKAYKEIVFVGLFTYLLAKLIGAVFPVETIRPFEVAGKAAGASFLNKPCFPSDHTLFATTLAAAVWFETKQKALTWIIAGLIIVVAVGRVLALVHTPADVIGGVVIALIGSIWYLNFKKQ
jgi:membrane-associated phospholipid phosphatase